ncbi:MAG: KOW domain-containing RNA-binding protein [Oscillospiraceae bacterium]|jgi:ribosomal protein L14E/L6E/L27E|nr:KOW domain-containing RNA-binding protein [Oscillospiraceae bacterium]
MQPYTVGDIALSLAGRDAKKLFAVVGILDEDYVYISDGKSRKAASPKKKKTKHIRLIKKIEGDFAPADAAIRKMLADAKETQQQTNIK